jgi:hypothetical protein
LEIIEIKTVLFLSFYEIALWQKLGLGQEYCSGGHDLIFIHYTPFYKIFQIKLTAVIEPYILCKMGAVFSTEHPILCTCRYKIWFEIDLK